MKRRQAFSRALVLLFLFLFPLVARGEWRLDPVSTKLKWEEDQTSYLAGGGWGYYHPSFRWTNDLRWRNNRSPSQPAYYKTELRRRIVNDWWLGVAGRYATAPTCDFRWAQVELEKALARPVAFRLWGAGEWRRVTAQGSLEDYDQQIVGSRLRWRLFPSLQWKGELSKESKTYPTPRNSSAKTALSNEVTWRVSPHSFLGRWTESTRVYPEKAWENYHHQSFRLEWDWNISQKAFFEANCGYNRQSQGSGKEGAKIQFTGILNYPYTADYKLSWLVSSTKKIASYDPLLEEGETELPDAHWRFGLRLQEFSLPVTIRAELFCAWVDGLTGGWLVRLQGRQGPVGWRLGLAPQGGFYLNEEKGYWLEVKYYLD